MYGFTFLIVLCNFRVTTACFSSAALRTGNRLYMYCSCSIILSICCFLLASFSHWREEFISTHSVFGFLPLVITITMFIAHAFGINSVLHLLTAEVSPTYNMFEWFSFIPDFPHQSEIHGEQLHPVFCYDWQCYQLHLLPGHPEVTSTDISYL